MIGRMLERRLELEFQTTAVKDHWKLAREFKTFQLELATLCLDSRQKKTTLR